MTGRLRRSCRSAPRLQRLERRGARRAARMSSRGQAAAPGRLHRVRVDGEQVRRCSPRNSPRPKVAQRVAGGRHSAQAYAGRAPRQAVGCATPRLAYASAAPRPAVGPVPFCQTPSITSNAAANDWTVEPNLCSNTCVEAPGGRAARAGGPRPGGAWGSAPPGRARSGCGGRRHEHDRRRCGPDRPRCRVAPSALALLESARQGLAAAESEPRPAAGTSAAHLAALRAAAAIVAARAEPGAAPRRRRPQSVWELLPQGRADAERVGRVLRRWRRQAGRSRGRPAARVSAPEADELLRDAATFVSLAESALGVPAQSLLPLLTAG